MDTLRTLKYGQRVVARTMTNGGNVVAAEVVCDQALLDALCVRFGLLPGMRTDANDVRSG